MLEDEANVKGNENMSTEMSIDAFFLSRSVSLSLWRPGHRESGIAIGLVSGQVELTLALI